MVIQACAASLAKPMGGVNEVDAPRCAGAAKVTVMTWAHDAPVLFVGWEAQRSRQVLALHVGQTPVEIGKTLWQLGDVPEDTIIMRTEHPR